jgi:hypothetical protein
LWSRFQAVACDTPNDRSSVNDDTPAFEFVNCHVALNHTRRSKFVFANTVSDVTVERRRHDPHHQAP